MFGWRDWVRTSDLSIIGRMLSQLSYTPMCLVLPPGFEPGLRVTRVLNYYTKAANYFYRYVSPLKPLVRPSGPRTSRWLLLCRGSSGLSSKENLRNISVSGGPKPKYDVRIISHGNRPPTGFYPGWLQANEM